MLDAARHCDLAILNGGHGATVAMLLAGKPVLLIPIYLEQTLMARAVERLGAGLMLRKDSKQVAELLQRLLGSTDFAARAAQFACKYSAGTLEGQTDRILTRLENMIAGDAKYRRTVG